MPQLCHDLLWQVLCLLLGTAQQDCLQRRLAVLWRVSKQRRVEHSSGEEDTATERLQTKSKHDIIIYTWSRNGGLVIMTHSSSLEGARKLKLASFCSSSRALSNDIQLYCFAEIKMFRFWPKTMNYIYIIRRFDQISFRPHNSSLEGARKLKFASFFCS